MDIASVYGNHVRKYLDSEPSKAGRLIRKGLHLEGFRCKHFADKRIPEAYRLLNYKGISLVAKALDHPESLAWVNIFAPVEILQCFNLTCVSMECLSSYLAGFHLEDYFIDKAESEGIASTLCSYHRCFIGAVSAGVIPHPAVSVTTSMICDGNVSTFRYLEERCGVPAFVIDIPHVLSDDAVFYVKEQLEELIRYLEERTGMPFDINRLRTVLKRENLSRKHYLSYLKKRKVHSYPNTLSLVVFQLFATHLSIGEPWVLEVFRKMDSEIEKYPFSDEKRLFWVHIVPYAQETLRSRLNLGDQISIAWDDFNLDYTEMLDTAHPLEALSRKMICNLYNGDFSRKTERIAEFVREYDPDGIVELCHWGCRQSCGGAALLKEKMKETGKPMLILDGDAIDRRNCPDGQIRTRFEAFLEMLGM